MNREEKLKEELSNLSREQLNKVVDKMGMLIDKYEVPNETLIDTIMSEVTEDPKGLEAGLWSIEDMENLLDKIKKEVKKWK